MTKRRVVGQTASFWCSSNSWLQRPRILSSHVAYSNWKSAYTFSLNRRDETAASSSGGKNVHILHHRQKCLSWLRQLSIRSSVPLPSSQSIFSALTSLSSNCCVALSSFASLSSRRFSFAATVRFLYRTHIAERLEKLTRYLLSQKSKI